VTVGKKLIGACLTKLTYNSKPDTSALCIWPVDPYVIKGYLVRFLEWKFSRKENIQNQFLRDQAYLWKPDDTVGENRTTGILIASSGEYNSEAAHQRPACIVKLGPVRADRISLADRVHSESNLIGTVDPNQKATLGFETQTLHVRAGYTVFCIGETEGSAENLGLEVWHSLLDHQQVIRRDLGLIQWAVGDMQSVGKLREFKDTWATPIRIATTFNRTVILEQESKVLKAFSVEQQLS
jgi:hypothetical protein